MESDLYLLNLKHQKELFRLTQFGLKKNLFVLQKEKNNYSTKNSRKKNQGVPLIPYENYDYNFNYNSMEQGQRDQKYELYEQTKAKRFQNYKKKKRNEEEEREKKQRFQNERASLNLQRTSLDCALRREKIMCDIEMKDALIYMNRRSIEKNRLMDAYTNFNKEKEKKESIKNLKEREEYNLNLKRDYIENNQLNRKKYNAREISLKEIKNSMVNSFDSQRKENIKSLRMILQQNIDADTKNQIKNEFEGDKDIIKQIDKLLDKYDKDKKKILEEQEKEKKIEKEEKEKKAKEKEKEEERKKEKEMERLKSKSPSAKERTDQNIIPELQKSKKYNIENEDEDDDDKKILTELEIRQKVREFKNKRYKAFLELVDEQKNEEKKRDRQLELVRERSEKLKLEEKFGKERTLASFMLKKERDKIEEDVEYFEQQLREENLNLENINSDNSKNKT